MRPGQGEEGGGVIRATERSGDEAARAVRGQRARVVGVLLGALLLGTLSACGGGATPTAAPTAAPTAVATVGATATAVTTATASASATTTSGPATTTVPRAATPSASATRGTMDYPYELRQALAQVAADLGVAPDQLTIVAVEARDWPDSSLGCPQPGRAYSQIITPGYRLVVRANGQEYEYHTSARTTMIVRCTP
jgi:ABC-type transport system substrate-binding protein